MKKNLIATTVLIVLSSSQLMADGISGGARFNMHRGSLIVPCVKVNDPGGPLDGKYFDVEFGQRGRSLNFEVILGEEEEEGVCTALIEASLNADDDTDDVSGDLGDEPENNGSGNDAFAGDDS